MAGVPDLEPHRADTQPDGLRGAEEAGRFAVTAALAGQNGEALKDVGNEPRWALIAAANASAS